MPRYPKSYRPNGSQYFIFYYRDASGKRRKRSTGCSRQRDAELEVRRFIDSQDRHESPTFRDYAAPYFGPACPHVQRLRHEGKSIGDHHISMSRYYLREYALADPVFPRLRIREITRGDIIDLRNRLVAEHGRRNFVNKVVQAVKTVLSEAEYRGDIGASPGSRVGALTYDRKDRDILTVAELQALFKKKPGVWGDDQAYSMFILQAATGMRSGEIRALTWDQIENEFLTINRAVKGKAIGPPKWGKVRHIVIPGVARAHLPSGEGKVGLVFPADDGKPRGERYMFRRWYNALVGIGVATATWDKAKRKHYYAIKDGRNLPPHSLRHTINTHTREAGADSLRADLYFGWSQNVMSTAAQLLSPMGQNYSHFAHEVTRPVAEVVDRILTDGAGGA